MEEDEVKENVSVPLYIGLYTRDTVRTMPNRALIRSTCLRIATKIHHTKHHRALGGNVCASL